MNPKPEKIKRQDRPWADETLPIPEDIRVQFERDPLMQVMLHFAASIRDRRHHPDSILERLKSFIFSFVPADKAMLFKLDDDQELSLFGGVDQRDPASEVKANPAVIDRTLAEGDLFADAMMCVRMRSFVKSVGLIYVDRADLKAGFDSAHLTQLKAVATVAAVVIDNANDNALLRSENAELRKELNDRYALVGESPAMVALRTLIEQVAKSNISALIQGETGTGKELVGRALHALSNRVSRPFLTVNCAALPENLVESELFGHEKGAFTGAIAQKKGKFEAAAGGSLFLDEVGELPLAMQSKLLRALQEKEIERVGNNFPLKVDVRVIAATNRDLAAEVKAGKFREDLYYRLNVVGLRTPPLRERPQDILLLARHFIAKYSEEIGRLIRGISPEVEEFLENYAWPGNVRELQNVIHRAAVLTRGDIILLEDLSPELREAQANQKGAKRNAFDSAKIEAVKQALRKTSGSVAKAAKMLGISPQYIYKLRDKGDLEE